MKQNKLNSFNQQQQQHQQKETSFTYMLTIRDSLQIYRHLLNDSEQMEKNIYHSRGCLKKAGVGTLLPDKTHFKTERVVRDKEGHYIIRVKTRTRRFNSFKYMYTQHRIT